MADLQTLFQAVDQLTADELKQLYVYIVETRMQFAAPNEGALPKERVLGLFEHVGETRMSDDFDSELLDSFWLDDDKS